MELPDAKIAELFNLLDHLADLEVEELLGHFTTDNVVQELHEMKKIWSDRLDKTLTSAAREFDQGNRVQALWILNGFIRFCPSPYYRDIAEGVTGKYEKQET
jgi:hypothetical protein